MNFSISDFWILKYSFWSLNSSTDAFKIPYIPLKLSLTASIESPIDVYNASNLSSWAFCCISEFNKASKFALAAAGEAIAQSGSLPYDPSRIGTIFGTGIGGLRTLEEQVIVRVEKGERRVSPFLVPMMMVHLKSQLLTIRFLQLIHLKETVVQQLIFQDKVAAY